MSIEEFGNANRCSGSISVSWSQSRLVGCGN